MNFNTYKNKNNNLVLEFFKNKLSYNINFVYLTEEEFSKYQVKFVLPLLDIGKSYSFLVKVCFKQNGFIKYSMLGCQIGLTTLPTDSREVLI